jgi:hypothetical protein
VGRKKGRKKKHHYFITLKKLKKAYFTVNPLYPYYLPNITKISRRCKSQNLSTFCESPLFTAVECLTGLDGPVLSFVGEVGSHLQNKNLLPYAALGAYYNSINTS